MAYPINALASPYQDSMQLLKARIPDDYEAGPVQKLQEAQSAVPLSQNAMLMNGPDGGFYRALAAFQDHFGGRNG